MSEWTNVWLGIIAGATLLMALIQVGLIVAGALIYRRLLALTTRVERELEPLFGKVNAIGADAARISALAAQQAERADALLADVSQRVDATLAVVQNAVVAPAREGLAVVAAIKGAVNSLRRRPSRQARDEDDPLFIG